MMMSPFALSSLQSCGVQGDLTADFVVHYCCTTFFCWTKYCCTVVYMYFLFYFINSGAFVPFWDQFFFYKRECWGTSSFYFIIIISDIVISFAIAISEILAAYPIPLSSDFSAVHSANFLGTYSSFGSEEKEKRCVLKKYLLATFLILKILSSLLFTP